MAEAELTAAELRLGELVEEFESRRDADPSVGVGVMRDEAGELFDDLAAAVEGRCVIEAGLDPMAERIPAQFDGYFIESRLGAGMSGVVYAARDRDGRAVALKVMHESLALSADGLKRFQRETEVARRLDHPHIVRALAHGSVGTRLYLVMELVDGAPLDEVVKGLKGPPDQTWLSRLDEFSVAKASGSSPAEIYGRRIAALFAPVAAALAHASEQGLIHRDLKPGNLMLGRDGKLRILDFGLAKLVGEEMTATAAVLGTPAYMSPEQAAGRSREVDARTDIYGLGAALYTVLTGRYPLEAKSFPEVISAILTRRPESITSFSSEYSSDLALLVSRCLEKQPSDRYPNHAALRADLSRVAGGKKARIGKVPFRRRARRYVRRHRLPVAVATALLAVLLAAGGWYFTRPAFLVVSCHPEGALFLDGDPQGPTPFENEVPRGLRKVRIERERFVPHIQEMEFGAGDRTVVVVHLRPKDPFDKDALAVLAESYGVSSRLPGGEPIRPRGMGEEVGDRLEPRDPEAFERQLSQFDETIRSQPHIRLLAASALLEQGLFAEAYHAAVDLSGEFPGRVEPLRLAMRALDQLRLSGTTVYRDLYRRYLEAKRG